MGGWRLEREGGRKKKGERGEGGEWGGYKVTCEKPSGGARARGADGALLDANLERGGAGTLVVPF